MLTFNFSEPAVIDTARRVASSTPPPLTLKERIKRERKAFVAKMRAKTEARRAQVKRSAEIKAQRKAADAKLRKDETDSLSKTAGITPQVKRLAAEGHKGAQEFLRKARGRVAAARQFQIRNPTTFVQGRGAVRVTRTVHNANFLRKKARVIAAGESVKDFERLFAKEGKALERAKGAASGESRKAGLETDDKGFLKPIGTKFKANIFDSVGISSGGSVTKFGPISTTQKPLGQGRVGASSAVLSAGKQLPT